MMAKSHVAVSLTACTLAAVAAARHAPGTPLDTGAAEVVSGALIGALVPDMDTDSSVLGRIVKLPGKHRTWTHAIWIPAVLGYLAWRTGSGLAAMACAGWLAHIGADWLSRGGVCLLWPLTRYLDETDGYTYHVAPGHRPKLYYTGKPSEYVTAAVLTVAMAAAAAHIQGLL